MKCDLVMKRDLNGFTALKVAKMENKPKISKLMGQFISEHIGIYTDDMEMAENEERMKMKIAYRLAVQNRINAQTESVMTEHETKDLKDEYLESADVEDNGNENEIEIFDSKLERYWMECLRQKFGFLSLSKMDKVNEIRNLWFHTLQRTACDYTNAFRNLNRLSIFGVNGKGQTVAQCMKQEDGEYLEYVLTQCASIEIYNEMGYEPKIQNTIDRIEWSIAKKVKIHGVSANEMEDLVDTLKRRSVIIYDKNDEEEPFMNLEIKELESEQQKQRRDRILWTRFIAKYREMVNDEYEGDIPLNEPLKEETAQEIKSLNDERVKLINAANPKYILRNYLMQQSIVLSKKKDYSMVRQLLQMVEKPFVTQPECDHNDFTCPVPLESCGFCVSCAS